MNLHYKCLGNFALRRRTYLSGIMRDAGTMMLKLNGDDARELRIALEQTRASLVRELAQLAGCGASAAGIELCRRRARVERLIDYLEHPPLLQLVSTRVAPHRDLDLAA